MPDLNELYPSKWIKASDLKGRQVTVTIDRVEVESLGNEMKPVVYFKGRDKGLVCNKTNGLMLAEICGSSNTDDWPGHSVTLFSQKVQFEGRLTDAVRCMAAATQKQPRQAQPANVPAEENPFNEDEQVPF